MFTSEMKISRPITVALALLIFCSYSICDEPSRGTAQADQVRPGHFPHRIWAACDFEAPALDYAWFGVPETNNIPSYGGNRTALRTDTKQQTGSGLMIGINPVPGPRIGQENFLYMRYLLRGNSEATFQYFSLTT